MNKQGLFSLERRRLKGDLVEVYKIMRDIDRVDRQRLFPRVEVSITRGHRFKARGGTFKKDVKKKVFHSESGGCPERTARGDGESRYINNI